MSARLRDSGDIIGFWSYSRDDDRDSNDYLSMLRAAIQADIRSQLGVNRKQLTIFQDKAAISQGKQWLREIEAASDRAHFFIPIVSPTAIKSPQCLQEFEFFRARETSLGRHDLIFPILYLPTPQLEEPAPGIQAAVVAVINERQFEDWTDVRHLPLSDPAVKKRISDFARAIVAALSKDAHDRKPVTPPEPPPPQNPPLGWIPKKTSRWQRLMPHVLWLLSVALVCALVWSIAILPDRISWNGAASPQSYLDQCKWPWPCLYRAEAYARLRDNAHEAQKVAEKAKDDAVLRLAQTDDSLKGLRQELDAMSARADELGRKLDAATAVAQLAKNDNFSLTEKLQELQVAMDAKDAAHAAALASAQRDANEARTALTSAKSDAATFAANLELTKAALADTAKQFDATKADAAAGVAAQAELVSLKATLSEAQTNLANIEQQRASAVAAARKDGEEAQDKLATAENEIKRLNAVIADSGSNLSNTQSASAAALAEARRLADQAAQKQATAEAELAKTEEQLRASLTSVAELKAQAEATRKQTDEAVANVLRDAEQKASATQASLEKTIAGLQQNLATYADREQAQKQNEADVAEATRRCDDLAAHPEDPSKPADVKGVLMRNMSEPEEALRFCEIAAGAQATDGRIVFQLGRAVEGSGDTKRAFGLYLRAAGLGHAMAHASIAQFISKVPSIASCPPAKLDKDISDACALLAYPFYLRAASLGAGSANREIGWWYEAQRKFLNCSGAKDCDNKALQQYRIAYENNGDRVAAWDIGDWYFRKRSDSCGMGEAECLIQSFNWFQKAESIGPDAIFRQGLDYEKAIALDGVPGLCATRSKCLELAIAKYTEVMDTSSDAKAGLARLRQ